MNCYLVSKYYGVLLIKNIILNTNFYIIFFLNRMWTVPGFLLRMIKMLMKKFRLWLRNISTKRAWCKVRAYSVAKNWQYTVKSKGKSLQWCCELQSSVLGIKAFLKYWFHFLSQQWMQNVKDYRDLSFEYLLCKSVYLI